jgi:hypothetical protein
MLANILAGLAAGGAILTLLDIFLSEKIKAWLSRMVTVIWSYLDDLRSLSLLDWLKNPRAKTWLALTIGLFLLTIEALQAGAIALIEEGLTLHAVIVMSATIWAASIVLISSMALPAGRYYWLKMLAILLGAAALFVAVAPSAFAYIAAVAVLVVVSIVFISRPIFARLLEISSGRYALLKLFSCSILVVLILLFFWFWFLESLESHSNTSIVLLIFVLLLGLIVLCAFLILMSICFAYIATAVLYVVELVVRRIAEYPRGPLLALIAIFGGAAALLKVFAR